MDESMRPEPIFIGGINVAPCEYFPQDVYNEAIKTGEVPDGTTCKKYGFCAPTKDCLFKKYIRLLDACGLTDAAAKDAIMVDGIDVHLCKNLTEGSRCNFYTVCTGNYCKFKDDALRDRISDYKSFIDHTAERIRNVQVIPYQRCETVRFILDEIANDMKAFIKRML